MMPRRHLLSSMEGSALRGIFIFFRRKEMIEKKSFSVRKLVFAAVCLALCMVLPLITMHIQAIGNALCPMHIGVLLCGFICGPWYGLAVGFIAPLLRFALFGMPPIYPTGLAMCFELAAYGLFAGILYKALPKNIPMLYVSLICSMLLGRIVWGLARCALALFGGVEFSWQAFVAGGFTTAIPGIILHIVIIPPIVLALKKAKLAE